MLSKFQRLLLAYNYTQYSVLPCMIKAGVSESDIQSVKHCLSNLSVFKCSSCGKYHYATSFRCKNRFCVLCSHFKTVKYISKLIKKFNEWILSPGHYIVMLNFTIVDSDNLKDSINCLNKCFRGLRTNRGDREWFDSRFPGGVRSLEVKVGSGSKKWHPHLHCLVMQDGYGLDYERLKNTWNRLVCRYYGVSDNDNKLGSVYLVSLKDKSSIYESLLEVIKYILKPCLSLYHNPKVFKTAYDTLKGKRQVNCWGSLYGIQQEVDSEDLDLQEDFICDNCGSKFSELVFIDEVEKRSIYENFEKG